MSLQTLSNLYIVRKTTYFRYPNKRCPTTEAIPISLLYSPVRKKRLFYAYENILKTQPSINITKEFTSWQNASLNIELCNSIRIRSTNEFKNRLSNSSPVIFKQKYVIFNGKLQRGLYACVERFVGLITSASVLLIVDASSNLGSLLRIRVPGLIKPVSAMKKSIA